MRNKHSPCIFLEKKDWTADISPFSKWDWARLVPRSSYHHYTEMHVPVLSHGSLNDVLNNRS